MENNELEKMINTFDMKKFLDLSNNEKEIYGAWLIITNNQYVIGYTDHDGLGYHGDSIRKALCEMFDVDRYDKIATPSFSQSNFIISSMMSGENTLYLLFLIDKLAEITPNQLKLFENFKNKYNDIIKSKSQNIQKRIILFSKNKVEYAIEDLDILYDVLSSMVNQEKILPNDVNIIGNPLLEKVNKRTF